MYVRQYGTVQTCFYQNNFVFMTVPYRYVTNTVLVMYRFSKKVYVPYFICIYYIKVLVPRGRYRTLSTIIYDTTLYSRERENTVALVKIYLSRVLIQT